MGFCKFASPFQHGNTSLHEAAWKGFSQTVSVLCKSKANFYIKNRGGFAPLHLCCQNGHNETCRVLLLNGCKPDLKNNVRSETYYYRSHASFLHIISVRRHAPAHQRQVRTRGRHQDPGQRPVQRERAEQGENQGIMRMMEIIEKSAGNNKYPTTQCPGQSHNCSRGDAGTKFV